MKTSSRLQAPVALSPLRGSWRLYGRFGKRSTLAPTGNIETRLIGRPVSSLIPYNCWAILAPQFICNSRVKPKQSRRQNVFVLYQKSQSNNQLYLVLGRFEFESCLNPRSFPLSSTQTISSRQIMLPREGNSLWVEGMFVCSLRQESVS
jgi:hypothetical protein